MKISIIIVSYKRKDFTKYCIDSIYKNTNRKKYEIIVVDNNSDVNTKEFLKNYKKIDKVIFLKKNEYINGAFNIGFKNASKDSSWIVGFGNDTFVMNGWLENLERVVTDLNLKYIYITARMLSYHNKTPLTTKNNGRYMKKNNVGDRSKNSDLGIGGGFCIKKEIYDNLKIDLFPKEYVHSMHWYLCNKLVNDLNFHEGIDLDKPCSLSQDEQFDNPKFRLYYEEIFKLKKKKARAIKNFFNKKSRLVRNSDIYHNYYKNTDYLQSSWYFKE